MRQLKSVCLAAVFVLLSAISGNAFADDGGGGDGGGGGGDDSGDGSEGDSGGGDCGTPGQLSDSVGVADAAVASANEIAAIAQAITGQSIGLETMTAQLGALNALSQMANSGQLTSGQMDVAIAAALTVAMSANLTQDAITELAAMGDLESIQPAIDAQTANAVNAVSAAINALSSGR